MDSRFPLRLAWFYAGLVIMTFGYALIIGPGFGAAPWDIFHLGLHQKTGVPLGLVIQLMGVLIILIDVALQIKPTLGMFLNMLSVGPILQFMLARLPVPESLIGRGVMLAAGLLTAGLGLGLYISAGLGAGPRDGLMLGLTRKLGLPVAVIKNGIDITVALLGYWLGGPLGVGTVLVALTIGPSVQFGLHVVNWLSQVSPFSTFVEAVPLKRG